MNIQNNYSRSSIFNISSRNHELKQYISNLEKNINNNVFNNIKDLEKTKLSNLEKTILKIITYLRAIVGLKSDEIKNLLENQKSTKNIIKFYKKVLKLYPQSHQLEELPHIFIAGKLDKLVTKYKFKAIKAQLYSENLGQIQQLLDMNQSSEKLMMNQLIFKKIKCMLYNIAEIYSDKQPEQKKWISQSFDNLLKKLATMTNKDGQNVIEQLKDLYIKKNNSYSKIVNLHVIKQKIENGLALPELQKELQGLSFEILFTLKIKDLERIEASDILDSISQEIENQETYIKKIDNAFDDFLNKVYDELSVYEVSASRLVEEFSPQILNKPINVTMIGVEYSGLVKEGGLAEALEGMTKALKNQHPDNKVRLIFPKFNIFPTNIQEKLDQIQPKTYLNSKHQSYSVYTIEIEGIEYNFIEDSLFNLTGEKPSIYGSDDTVSKMRFATFSGLAADFIKEIKTDIIHLHDWHVAGVALKLHKDVLEEKEVPPIVFTYHNNSRVAQGRFGQGIYNYGPVIQGLLEAGISTENVNAFVETIKKADAITTVSETFGIESQDMRRGEGVSFAAREAAEAGKLTGIINGSNPHAWNPEKDAALKNWKDPEAGISIDLTYGSRDGNKAIIEKKEQCKTQLQKWVAQNFPQAKMDFTQPIITYIGRLDSFQKGLDKLEEAIDETIKNGGQFIVMGSLEDEKATLILDKLEAKYKENVLFIRDYKDPNGRYHFQQGDTTRQGCGSLVRGASDFILVPSRFEPCGLVQFEGWLFGSLAIGSNVGGLADTIISPQKNAENFNGFLFNRDSTGKDSIRNAIQTGLKTWKGYTQEQKGQIVRRIIEDGKKYSWSTSPSGYSPIEKYRFVYENAKKFAAQRATNTISRINLNAQISKIRDKNLIQHDKASAYDKMEENYNKYFYSKNFNFKKLERMYKALPENLRMQVPSPYGHKVNSKTYEELGAHFITGSIDASSGVRFSVEAPQAKTIEVRIFTDKNTIQVYKLTKTNNGYWTGFIPGLAVGTKYQYLVNGQAKLDPVGLSHVPNPTPGEPPCSVVTDRTHDWQDQEWMASRIEKAGKSIPISIYEVHPLFWNKKDGKCVNYCELANELVRHCKAIGYTHVELMGILEHPDERSWGYQVTGFFAPNSRMGTPKDFKYLVDTLHKNQIGVYLDWIPSHFAVDKYALSNFDGSNQYQPSKMALLFSLRNIAFRWGVYFFDFKKKIVRDFLTSSAAYWLKEMHIDGLRVDAVRSILLSEDAKSSRRFLRDLNAVVHRDFPGVMMMAEDYSGASETTKSMAVQGLGFDQKWNIGWMKHSLEYFAENPKDRLASYDKIITAIGADTSHKMILAISHDEVTKKMKALIEKNSNLTLEEKFANLRAFFGYFMSVPGKKLMFMGSDIGLSKAWDDFIGTNEGVMQTKLSENAKKSLDAFQRLNKIYKTYEPFWQHDDNANDLTWIEKNDPEKRIHAYRRTSDNGKSIACLHNFSDNEVQEFVVMLENKEILKELETLALKWKETNKDIKNKLLSPLEMTRLGYLSRYPNIAKKIASNAKLRNEFFTWIVKSEKPTKEFFKKHDWQSLEMLPHEIFNSDDEVFGGQGRTNKTIEYITDDSGTIFGYKVRIPPLSNVFISENTTPNS
jgi:alpha-1,4-glucan:alpha-1,4-glucan 6-glycosyltransferase